jgi:hypothetical protein
MIAMIMGMLAAFSSTYLTGLGAQLTDLLGKIRSTLQHLGSKSAYFCTFPTHSNTFTQHS